MEFIFGIPCTVFFGEGKAKNTGEIVGSIGAKKVFCVYDQGVAKVAAGVVNSLKEAGMSVIEFDGVVPNPPDYLVEEAAQKCREAGVDAIVAIGGGSPIDVAKAINVLLTNPSPIHQYDGLNKVTIPTKPLIAIPTTAGTGSEVTTFAIVTDTSRHKKMIIAGQFMGANIAIVDPELTVGMPPAITASTGMDALTHAIEAYVSILRQIPADVNALKAIELISSSIEEATANGSNIAARSNMILGSTMAGFAFTNAVLGLVHGIAHPLSVRCGLPHGVANAILLPYVMEFNASVVPERTVDIGKAMGLKLDGLSQEAAIKKTIDRVFELNKKIKIPTLKEVNVKKEQFEQLADDTLRDTAEGGAGMFNPRPASKEEIIALLEKAF
ncbi:1,3-propanediol dehydrogenase [Sporomusa silvacetica DSM 10669]|uniref:1,3-propanediol dehydrogenase n=1 Tax=Sporomusa silvacetica DSM 10669 TaxID=1123289 RepID=A0ABZ3IP47_9FIRM|nr:iron-containing alcohol dehydrogenase [Sporomusa silvacetica]OZC19878.1 1,3-propanediol dehydrogenase [Sporomusa silvacetica DSM 10669]